MQYLLIGIVIVVLVIVGLRAFLNANPKDLARTLRKIAGLSALLLAAFFAVTGRFVFAVPLGIVAMSLLGRNFSGAGGFSPFPGSARKSAGQTSRVRTQNIEMELDHDTGDMEGTVLKGRFASHPLSSLDEPELLALLGECRTSDPQAAQLIEAYLDRRFPDWHAQAGQSRSSDQGTGQADGPMSTDEAYEILGLEPGASKSDIRRAHRNLMKKMHPDHGGSTYFAAKINQAKDLLLGS
ncbi:MAG: DnaJ domain-containing protein [Hyphomicrobiaceae bacterium]|nr:DnaJ domain-containing protein [Hyphomicrobiaceae bacterium]